MIEILDDGVSEAERLRRVAWGHCLKAGVVITVFVTLVLILFPALFPNPLAMLEILVFRSGRSLGETQEAGAVIGWLLVFGAASGVAALRWRFRDQLRCGSIARACRELGLEYLPAGKVRRSFVAHRFHQLGLVPDHNRARVDDLIGWSGDASWFVFAELKLLNRDFARPRQAKVFEGALLFLSDPSIASEAGGWRSFGDPIPAGSKFGRLLERITELSTALQAEEIEAVLAEEGLFVAIAQRRDCIPIPPFFHGSDDSLCFGQAKRDLRAVAAVLEALAPGRQMAGPVSGLPAQLAGRYPFWPRSLWQLFTGVAILIAVTFGLLAIASLTLR